MRKMVWIVLTVLMLMVLVACGNKVDDDTSNKIITKAEDVVSLLHEEKYEDLYAMLNEEMEEGLPADEMKRIFPPVFGQSGDFEKISKSSVEEKDGHYIVVIAANYSKENRIFTITFNEQEEVAGLFVK